MEHVLRQCLIALRLADALGLDEELRSTTYYSALLVDVGCHTDAHEQAKWFGDDIAMKSTSTTTTCAAVAGTLADAEPIGAGNQPLHRLRVGVEFFTLRPQGSRRHGREPLAAGASAGARAGLPQRVQDAVGTAYERWDGRGWPGELAGDADPARVALSPARRVRRGRAPHRRHRCGATSLAEERAGGQFDPRLAQALVDDADADPRRPRRHESWDAVIEAEPGCA